MHIEKMKSMQEKLAQLIEEQDLKCVNVKQYGEAIDALKDLSEAIYYSVITKSMEQTEKEKQEHEEVRTINYYSPTMGGGPRYYTPNKRLPEEYMPYGIVPDEDSGYYRKWEIAERNPMEGKSPVRRRMYMEGKQQHHDIPSQLHELEAYLQELSSDITEMMKDSSPEEKNTLRQKMNNIINKLV